MEKNEIAVFICEDNDVAREIVGKYLKQGQVTYAEFLPKSSRQYIVEAIRESQEEIGTN